MGCHSLLQGIFWIKPGSSALQADTLPSDPPGKPKRFGVGALHGGEVTRKYTGKLVKDEGLF